MTKAEKERWWYRELVLGIEDTDKGGLARKFVMVAIDLKFRGKLKL